MEYTFEKDGVKMTFKRGPQYRVFITTENQNASIDLHTTPGEVVATTSSGNGLNSATLTGIGKLGEVTTPTATNSVVNEIKNVEAIEPSWAWEDDPFTVFGQTRPLDNPIRKSWTVTITKKAEDLSLGMIHSDARFGVTGSATPVLFTGLTTMPDTTGYRIYIFDGDKYALGMHGTFQPDGYKETLSPTGVTVQAFTLKGGLWYLSVPTTSSDVTSSVSITQT